MVRLVNSALQRLPRGAGPRQVLHWRLPAVLQPSRGGRTAAAAAGRSRLVAEEMPPARGEGWRRSPHTHAAAQPGTAEEGAGDPAGLSRSQRPAGEPVLSRGNQPRCRRGAGRRRSARLFPPRRQPFNGRAAPSASASPLTARPGRGAAGPPGASTPHPPPPRPGAHPRPPPALGSRLSPPAASQTPHPAARRARRRPPRPELPPRTAPHLTRPRSLTARHDRGSPPAAPLGPRGCPGLPPPVR